MARSRYTSVAIALHWAIALAMIAMIPLGLWMTGAIDDPDRQATAYRAFQLHKSIGLTVLGLTLVRIGWRLVHSPPPFPREMKAWEKLAARTVHAAFYIVLIAMPLTGWLYVSTGWSVATDQPLAVATSWFGLVQVPHIAGVPEAAAATRRSLAFGAMGAHEWIAWGAVALIGLHVGAALKHQFLDRDGVLGQMIPPLRKVSATAHEPPTAGGTAAWLAGFLLVVAVGAAGWMLASPPGNAVAVEDEAEPSVPAQVDSEIVPGKAQAWAIDYENSSIGFAGSHAGSPFSGRFDDWEGHVWFDPGDLAGSRATVLVNTASAKTGDATQEGSLAEAEWFNTAQFQIARFEVDEFEKLADDSFVAKGSLQIKGASVPVALDFTFEPTGNSARVKGSASLDRKEIDMGMASDASGSWVSRNIAVEISILATRK